MRWRVGNGMEEAAMREVLIATNEKSMILRHYVIINSMNAPF